MNNDVKNIYDKFKIIAAINNFQKEDEKEISKKSKVIIPISWRYIMKKRIIAIACTSIVLVSGVVFAANNNNIKQYFRNLGKGIDSAANNGYVANPEMNFVESNATVNSESGEELNNINVNAKIDDFIMDDLNLSTKFSFEFDDSIKEYLNVYNIEDIGLNDLIVRDENNNIIYGGNDEEAFKEYCKVNNLDYVYGETNDNYLNTGLNFFIDNDNEKDNIVSLIYNMYSDGFPKSKKLYFSFSKITLTEKDDESGNLNKFILNGNWNINVDVPSNMYNRTSDSYKVISCDNDNFDIYVNSVSDTGFEIGAIISNIAMSDKNLSTEELKQISTLDDDLLSGKITQTQADELKNKYNDYMYKNNPISLYSRSSEYGKTYLASYVQNSNGEKFESTLSLSRKSKAEWLKGNKYNFYDTFSMTKYDETQKIKVILYYYGEPVTIELEKINS